MGKLCTLRSLPLFDSILGWFLITIWPLLNALIQLGLFLLDACKLTGANMLIGRGIAGDDLFDLGKHGSDSVGHYFGRSVCRNQLFRFDITTLNIIEAHFIADLRRTQRNTGIFYDPFNWIERHSWQCIRSHSSRQAKDHNQQDGSDGRACAQDKNRQMILRACSLGLTNFPIDLTPDPI
jgi:hypothetical protein